mmetsp:Transcript_7425/g.12774  ORF Transcript_7425/g.12774 Transcript_7425/m.12774 type:complete len:188 (-) Transcript_7425:139-702(-)
MPAVTIAFKYEEQEWTHKFDMDVNASILDLKRKMTSSAPEHAAWFELRKDGLAVKSSDSVDPQVIYDFEYLGPDAEPVANGLTNGHSTEAMIHEEVAESPANDSTATSAPAVPRWRITGGADKGGIIVRQSESLKSPELGRVSTGAIVEEVARVGERLCYRLEEGSGPAKGWVSIRVSGKELVEKLA